MLIISHKNDIDGMGGVALLKLACNDVDYILCEDYNINQIVMKEYLEGNLDKYEKIFITDLHLNDKCSSFINKTSIKDKLVIFDHNESVTHLNSYPFANIVISKDGKLCCSTTLLYEYLTSNNMLKPNHALDTFCEATRIYDIGQWELNGQNQTPRDLSLLYEIYGPDKYIDVMTKKLKRNSKHFLLNKFERESIKLRKELIQQTVMSYIGNMDYKNICGHKAGIAYISYAFRNEVAQCLRKNNTKNIDVVILISLDNSSISIRNVKTDINVRPIAEKLGGKGHFGAGGCYINEDNIDEVLKIVL